MVDFRCTSRMDFHEKHCVHLHSSVAGVRRTAAASLLRATLSFIYNLRDAHLLSFSPKVIPAMKVYCFCRDCNKIFMAIKYEYIYNKNTKMYKLNPSVLETR